jgi:hypothetical protein
MVGSVAELVVKLGSRCDGLSHSGPHRLAVGQYFLGTDSERLRGHQTRSGSFGEETTDISCT